MSVTIRARLPKGDTNGLAHLERKLLDGEAIIIIGIVRGTDLHRPIKPKGAAANGGPSITEEEVVQTTLLHLEAVDGKNAESTEKLMRRVYEQRTGKRELPFEETPPEVVVEGNFPSAPDGDEE